VRIPNNLAALFLLLAGSWPVLGQQVAFTTRSFIESPIVLSSFAQSKVFGFETVMLMNDGDVPVTAVRLQVAFRTLEGDEIVEDRRFAVELRPRETKRTLVDLGHIQALQQKLTHGRDATRGLAILSVRMVEFGDGTSWQPGLPVARDPLQPAAIPPRGKPAK
jgi:hypothetical protein